MPPPFSVHISRSGIPEFAIGRILSARRRSRDPEEGGAVGDRMDEAIPATLGALADLSTWPGARGFPLSRLVSCWSPVRWAVACASRSSTRRAGGSQQREVSRGDGCESLSATILAPSLIGVASGPVCHQRCLRRHVHDLVEEVLPVSPKISTAEPEPGIDIASSSPTGYRPGWRWLRPGPSARRFARIASCNGRRSIDG